MAKWYWVKHATKGKLKEKALQKHLMQCNFILGLQRVSPRRWSEVKSKLVTILSCRKIISLILINFSFKWFLANSRQRDTPTIFLFTLKSSFSLTLPVEVWHDRRWSSGGVSSVEHGTVRSIIQVLAKPWRLEAWPSRTSVGSLAWKTTQDHWCRGYQAGAMGHAVQVRGVPGRAGSTGEL